MVMKLKPFISSGLRRRNAEGGGCSVWLPGSTYSKSITYNYEGSRLSMLWFIFVWHERDQIDHDLILDLKNVIILLMKAWNVHILLQWHVFVDIYVFTANN